MIACGSVAGVICVKNNLSVATSGGASICISNGFPMLLLICLLFSMVMSKWFFYCKSNDWFTFMILHLEITLTTILLISVKSIYLFRSQFLYLTVNSMNVAPKYVNIHKINLLFLVYYFMWLSLEIYSPLLSKGILKCQRREWGGFALRV